MKPGAAWREEPWWHWDWPGRPDPRMMGVSGVQYMPSDPPPQAKPTANLWVPDPEARRGWREYYVYRDAPAPTSARKLGL